MTTASSPWFPVAPHKFIVLSVFSFGIYDFYWVYQNWLRAQLASGEDISPFWRTFFFVPVYVFPLLRRIRYSAAAANAPAGWHPDALAVAFIVLVLTGLLPNIGFFISVVSFAPLLPAVRTIAAVNAAAGSPEGVNDRYTIPCVATIVFGGFIYAILIAATMLGL